ncbi:MAG: hypothetical protein BGO49_13390 [Planctomycetales bacterium 71-10]|nr:MAG: hypothetical protein BGO49_13390 [Planctomycetales bacterium 71-10]
MALPALCGSAVMIGASAKADFVSTWDTVANVRSAKAEFQAVGDTLTITLTNLTANPGSAADLLTRLQFQFTSGGPTTGSLTSSSGDEVSLAKVGGNTVATPGSSGVATGWNLSSSSGVLQLSMVGAPIAPKHGILGPAGSGGYYNNANPSLLGNHNPFLNGSATFVLNINGLANSGATISSATFIFNTEANISVDGKPGSNVIPEPSSVLMGGMALAALVGFSRFRRGRSA